MTGVAERVPRGAVFCTRSPAVGGYCEHRPDDVRIIGNVDRLKLWRCTACLNEVVPVFPGWAWDARNQVHVQLAAVEANRAAGHPGRYWPREES